MLKGQTSFNWKGFQVAVPNSFDKMTTSEWENILNLTMNLDASKKPDIKVYKPEEYLEKNLNELYFPPIEKADDTCTAITAVTMPDDWNGELPPGCDLDSDDKLYDEREHEIRKKMDAAKYQMSKYKIRLYLLILILFGLGFGFLTAFVKTCIFLETAVGLLLPTLLFGSVILFGGALFFFIMTNVTKCSEKIDKYRTEVTEAKTKLYKEIDDKNLTEDECQAKLKLKEIEAAMGPEFAEEYQRIKNL